MKARLARIRKLIAYVVAVAGIIVASGLVPEAYSTYILTGIGILGAVGLYVAPNAKEPDAVEPEVEDLVAEYSKAKAAVSTALSSKRADLAKLEQIATELAPVAKAAVADVKPIVQVVQVAADVPADIPGTPTGV